MTWQILKPFLNRVAGARVSESTEWLDKIASGLIGLYINQMVNYYPGANMSTETMIRAGGVASLICGAFSAVFWLVHPAAAVPGAVQDADYWAALQTSRYMLVNLSFVLILVCCLFALVALQARQSVAGGLPGFIGFLGSFIGSALFIGAGIFQAVVVPALAAREETRFLLEQSGPLMGGPMGAIFAATGILFGFGMALFGLSLFRAKVFPPYAGLMLLVSSPVLGLSPLMPPVARIVGCAIWGGAFVWLGLALRKG